MAIGCRVAWYYEGRQQGTLRTQSREESPGAVSAIDSDGTPKWSFNPENAASPVPAIGLDSRIYAGASDSDHSRLYAFEELGGSHGVWHTSAWPQDRGDRANTGRAPGGG